MLRIMWSGFVNLGHTRVILFALSEPKPVPKAFEAAGNHILKFATPDDIQALMHNPDYEFADVDVERVKMGGKCLLQMDGDTLVGYAWVWPNHLPYIVDGIHINLPDDTIYNYKSYTAPEYRGYGFQALRHLELLRQLKPNGIRRLFGFVDHLNSKSLRGVKKSGYIKVGELKIKHKANGNVYVNMHIEQHFWSAKSRI